MSKMQKSNKETKKHAVLTMKEKRAQKRSKKDSKEVIHSLVTREH